MDCQAAAEKQKLRNGRIRKDPREKDVPSETQAKIVRPLAFPIAVHKCKSWTVDKADREIIDSFETQGRGESCGYPRPPGS